MIETRHVGRLVIDMSRKSFSSLLCFDYILITLYICLCLLYKKLHSLFKSYID